MKKSNKISFVPTMGIGERKGIAGATERNAFTIGPKKIAWIPVDLLNIPPYQRNKERIVFKIATEWDDKKCDVLKVSYDKENGWFNVIDGQHRAAAARMRNVEYLVGEILDNLTVSEEAALFVECNVNSKKLSPFDTYHANMYIVGKDETETSKIDKRIAKVCDEYGVVVKKSQACGVLKTVPHVRKIIRREGEECLRFIIEVVQNSQWDKFKNGYSYVIIEALRKIYNTQINDLAQAKQKLCAYLLNHTPNEIDTLGNNKFANLGRDARWSAVLSQVVA